MAILHYLSYFFKHKLFLFTKNSFKAGKITTAGGNTKSKIKKFFKTNKSNKLDKVHKAAIRIYHLTGAVGYRQGRRSA